MEGMHEEADSQMSPPTLSTLDHAALTEICSKLDAKSLIALQMVSVDTRKAAIEDRPWR